jgi:hypothetical protein
MSNGESNSEINDEIHSLFNAKKEFKPTKNVNPQGGLNSSWSITDKEINPSPEGADLNLHRFKRDSKTELHLEDLKINNKNDSKVDKQNADNSDVGSNTTSANTTKLIEWSPENEMIMVEWCDIAQCYKWLNAKSYSKYSYKNAWYTIPAIVLSTISGTASFAQTSLPIDYQVYSPMAIGAINIFIGILTTIHQYLKISELTEAHRVSSISWDKFARNIRIELAKKPDERMDAGHFLKLNRQEFDRLMETSPMINDDVISEFNSTFQGKPDTIERKRFEALKKPDICNTIISANETRHTWYLELEKSNDTFDNSPLDNDYIRSKDELINLQQQQILNKEEELRKNFESARETERKIIENKLSQMKKAKEEDDLYNKKCQIINKYIQSFEELYERKPFDNEIKSNLKDVIENDVLDRFLKSYDFNIV